MLWGECTHWLLRWFIDPKLCLATDIDIKTIRCFSINKYALLWWWWLLICFSYHWENALTFFSDRWFSSHDSRTPKVLLCCYKCRTYFISVLIFRRVTACLDHGLFECILLSREEWFIFFLINFPRLHLHIATKTHSRCIIGTFISCFSSMS